jgi:hypothetical protein
MDSWLGGHFLIGPGGAKPDNLLDQISGSAQCFLRQVRVALRRSRMQVPQQSLDDIEGHTPIDQETRIFFRPSGHWARRTKRADNATVGMNFYILMAQRAFVFTALRM